jgi:hypothetical protein
MRLFKPIYSMVNNSWALLRGLWLIFDDRHQSLVAFQLESTQGELGDAGFEE